MLGSAACCKPLGQLKKAKRFIPTGPWVFAPTAFLFLLCSLVRIIYINHHRIYWLVIVDCFLPSQISVSNYTAKINILSVQNQERMKMNPYTFSAAQEICSKVQNQAKCDSFAFKTNPLKSYIFIYVLIAPKGYYS